MQSKPWTWFLRQEYIGRNNSLKIKCIERWGGYRIYLSLPALFLVIEGLSKKQFDIIMLEYANFVRSEIGKCEDCIIFCRVGRLPLKVDIPFREFNKSGQYTPLKTRDEYSIGVVGVNFRAQIDFHNHGPMHTSLCVYNESELAQAVILENFLRILIAYRVLNLGGVVLHSAGVLHRDQSFLFSGRSNAGKTTITRKAYDAGFHVLSDDINLVLPDDRGHYHAYRVPFTGEFGHSPDNGDGTVSVPLAGIALLEQGSELSVSPVTRSGCVARLLAGCPFVNGDSEEFPKLLDALTGLVSKVPVARLQVTKDDSIETIMHSLTDFFDADEIDRE